MHKNSTLFIIELEQLHKEGATMKNKIGLFLFIFAIFALSGLTYYSRQTVYNKNGTFGNTSGNLFNSGLYCEYEGDIYFSNQEDEGRLYVMNDDLSDAKKLSSDTAENINVAGKYIIYARHNQDQESTTENFFTLSNTGLYRMDKNGNNLKTLYDSVVNVVNLADNTVYYQRNTKSGFGTHQIDIDKSNPKEFTDTTIYPYTITDGYMYYTGVKEDHFIYRINLTSGEKDIVYKGNCAYVTYADNSLFYLDLDNDHAITRMNMDGTNPTVVTTALSSTYNVTSDGTYLYYQMDDGNSNGIYQVNLENNTTECIKLGNFCNINITKDYVFFQELGDTTTYVMKHSDTGSLTEFIPNTDQ